MNKIDLIAQVLSGELKDPVISEEERRAKIALVLRSFAADMLNIHLFFIGKNVEDNTLKEIMDHTGMDFNLKTKKFF